MEAVVVGGGIIGCAIAAEMARRGRTVTLLHDERFGQATVAAAGILGAQCEAKEDAGPALGAFVESRALWPRFLDEHRISREAVELRSDGAIELACEDAEVAELEVRAAWQ